MTTKAELLESAAWINSPSQLPVTPEGRAAVFAIEQKPENKVELVIHLSALIVIGKAKFDFDLAFIHACKSLNWTTDKPKIV